jgi:hypothetical protein
MHHIHQEVGFLHRASTLGVIECFCNQLWSVHFVACKGWIQLWKIHKVFHPNIKIPYNIVNVDRSTWGAGATHVILMVM